MPSQVLTSTENNFTKGLITEFTGLNFPENAATDADNCEFTIVGDVIRREGINFETNFALNAVSRTNKGMSSYVWTNVGGDGLTRLVVEQIGNILYFYSSSAATVSAPLSNQILVSTVDISVFVSTNGIFDPSLECQFAAGNGYLFVYNTCCDPIYCTYTAGVIVGNRITVNIRDFTGTIDGLPVNSRPSTLSAEHQYNLINQGWTQGLPWFAISSNLTNVTTGVKTFTVAAGLPVVGGDLVQFLNAHPASPFGVFQPAGSLIQSGVVSAYVGTQLTVNILTINPIWSTFAFNDWYIQPASTGYITSWFTAIGNYPSNADVWWYFKNSSGVFDPTTMVSKVTLNTGPAPKGKNILNAFSQQRSLVSSIAGITDVITTVRPRTGTWFQGRVWYAGVDAQQAATGDASYYTWTENIYFSQIVNTAADFGNCYQTNDPTSEQLFGLLPTDGGVISIQGCGAIYKLFPIQNGMLVFASNGIWFITGSQGIGFAANDYTITKISDVQSISGTSFINVQGLPYFWNEEGIYTVQPSKNNSLEVNPITVGTILSFYNQIPFSSRKYARGDYNPIDYVIQWTYRSTQETDVTSRYAFDSILNFNVYNKAFFPYSINNTTTSINGINYVSYPSITSTTPDPGFKYFSSNASGLTFADEHDLTYTDWVSSSPFNYDSFFVTGYKVHGQGLKRFQMSYIYVYSRAETPTSYKVQGLWDYATTGNSGRWSTAQLVNNWSPNFGMIPRRHKIRGQGLVLQIKISSLDGQPFDIMGWATFENMNQGI